MSTVAALPCRRPVAAPQRAAAPVGAVAAIAEVVISVATTQTFAQSAPSTSWTIAHGLNRFPSVTIVDTAGDLCGADVSYVDANTVAITFGAPTAGTVYFN